MAPDQPPANTTTAGPLPAGRTAVVLFNLGGPDSPAAIKPFLLNLFRDPAILRVPFFVRPLLARYIARARLKPATENYAILGGRSPLLDLTREQAEALEAELGITEPGGGVPHALPVTVAKPGDADGPFPVMVGEGRPSTTFPRSTPPVVDGGPPATMTVLGTRVPPEATTLGRLPGDDSAVKCFIAMRYWHPFSLETVRAVKAWRPDRIVLLPLYPQFSTTTTGSSLTAWREAAARTGLIVPTTTLCCYPTDAGFAAATAGLLSTAHDRARAALDPAVPLRVLFSAHGLPESIVKGGDPYQWQIEQTVAAVMAAWGRTDVDTTICYQSRATPQKWIGPSTDQEIERAGRDRVAVLVVPIAFVSEHSETLVELDVEYRELAEKSGVPGYFRVPAQNSDPGFIRALAGLIRRAGAHGPGLCSASGGRICQSGLSGCPFAERTAPAPNPG